MDNNEILKKAFSKLSNGFIFLGIAFLGMLLIIFFVGFGTQNTLEGLGNSSLSETSDKLNTIYSIVKFGSIICIIIATISCFYLSSVDIDISKINIISISHSATNASHLNEEKLSIIEDSYKQVGSIYLYTNDFSVKMKWEDAIKACIELGDGWRLPTKEELKNLYEFDLENNNCNFKKSSYWSSTSNQKGMAFRLSFSTGSLDDFNQESLYYVRAVRSIS